MADVSAYLRPFSSPADPDPITIVSGRGARVTDAHGREYIDALAALWFCHVGHGRAEIADAASDQMRRLAAFHCFELFTNEPAEALCAEVAAVAPMPDARVFLTSSGSEAVDTAMKLSRLVAHMSGTPERDLIVARTNAYHGVAYGGTSAQGLPPNQVGFGPLLDGIVRIAHDDLATAETAFAEHGSRIAAVLCEPVIGGGGLFPTTPEYLAGLRRLCDEHGALLVLDEVITGFGRVGPWFAGEHYGVEPDLVTFAKGVTSGYLPLGGVLVGRRVRDVLEADSSFILRHGFTYSGHPTSCAAGLANLAILRDERLLDRVPVIAERLGGGLRRLLDEGTLSDVRGVGGMWGATVPVGVDVTAVRTAMGERGVLTRTVRGDTVAFCPPYVIDDADLDRCVEVLADAIAASR